MTVVIRQRLDTLAMRMPACLGFGAVWGLQFGLFGTDALFSADLAPRTANDAFSIAMLLTVCLVSFCVAALAAHAQRTGRLLRLPLAGALASVVVGLTLVGAPLAGLLSPGTRMACGGTACGLGLAILELGWYRALVSLPSDEDALGGTAVAVAQGFLAGTLAMEVVHVSPPWLSLPAAAALLALGTRRLYLCEAGGIRTPQERQCETMPCPAARQASGQAAARGRLTGMLAPLLALIALILLYIAISQVVYLGGRPFSWYNAYLGVVEIAASALCLAAARHGRLDDNQLDVLVALAVVGVLFSVPFLGLGGNLAIVSGTVAAFCSHAGRVVAPVAFAAFARRAERDPAVVFGVACGTMKLPTMAATAISLPLIARASSAIMSVVLALLCVYALVIALYAMLHLSRRDSRRAQETIRELSESKGRSYAAYDTELRKRTSERIAQRFALTARERDVMEQLVGRKSLGEIAGALGLSPNTVKTHTRAVYAKLDIHGKDELATLFNSTRQEILVEDGA